MAQFTLALAVMGLLAPASAAPARKAAPPPPAGKPSLLGLLDAPLLFVKRHAYMAPHIYDDYYMWRPGGGIFVIANPAAPPAERKIRTIIDPDTPETLGQGVYREPELSWDATRIVFAFKGVKNGDTSLYEIGIDGRGLRRLTHPGRDCNAPRPARAYGHGQHDVAPAYLPDGRIVFTSTRQRGRVPCFNSGVDTLHVMNADGSDLHPISVNNTNEFDPAVMPDGRILYGRWEYVNKTALYMQSLWTVRPDGTDETAFFANNLAKPTAVLDARPVPGTHLVVASFTPHNGQSVGAICMIDTRRDKNDLDAVTNFTPEYPTKMDQGLKRGPCDPWPLSTDVVLIANNAKGNGVIQIVHRDGRRELVHADEKLSCFSPMLVKPRKRPTIIPPMVDGAAAGRFFLQDVYKGLTGVRRGEVKRLRVIEETTRVSDVPPGGRWWNEAFPVSWQGSYVVKNILGVVPVAADGSASFEAPPGRALYLQALDAHGRQIQSMRTFIQAVPGVTRSCVGCHENKLTTPHTVTRPLARRGAPAKIADESWGSGFLDYPTMVQPVLDKHCVSCHGGAKGIAGGIDLTGGWTWAFNISYETLIKNTLVGFLNCHNGAVFTARILPPRTHGSGVAPLAEVLVSGHKKRFPKLTAAERELILAWIDTNAGYRGTWDYTQYPTCRAILDAAKAAGAVMARAACTRCHTHGVGNDWINLRTPERSRILRAPLPTAGDGGGLAFCRDRPARRPWPVVTQRSQPPDVSRPARTPAPDPAGKTVISFATPADKHYQALLTIIRDARRAALARPRVDMPGADIIPGQCRHIVPVLAPETAPPITATARDDGTVELAWKCSAMAIGLSFELHRGGEGDFSPSEETLLATTPRFAHRDTSAPAGPRHYAIVATDADGRRSQPARVRVTVPEMPPPPAPRDVTVPDKVGRIVLRWAVDASLRYHVYRAPAGAGKFTQLTPEPIAGPTYTDPLTAGKGPHDYQVRAVNRRGAVGPPSATVTAAAKPESKNPVFIAFAPGQVAGAALRAPAKRTRNILDLTGGGYATVNHLPAFDLTGRFSVECWVRLDKAGGMPVVLSCGAFGGNGWFLQALGGRWRWHLGGVSCDGGQVTVGRWTHLVGTFDGQEAMLLIDGRKAASVPCTPNTASHRGPLVVGQYSSQMPQYQVTGQITGVKLYHRPLTPRDAVNALTRGRP